MSKFDRIWRPWPYLERYCKQCDNFIEIVKTYFGAIEIRVHDRERCSISHEYEKCFRPKR